MSFNFPELSSRPIDQLTDIEFFSLMAWYATGPQSPAEARIERIASEISEIDKRSKKLEWALRSLFDACVISDVFGELPDSVTRKIMDNCRSVLTVKVDVKP